MSRVIPFQHICLFSAGRGIKGHMGLPLPLNLMRELPCSQNLTDPLCCRFDAYKLQAQSQWHDRHTDFDESPSVRPWLWIARHSAFLTEYCCPPETLCWKWMNPNLSHKRNNKFQSFNIKCLSTVVSSGCFVWKLIRTLTCWTWFIAQTRVIAQTVEPSEFSNLKLPSNSCLCVDF
jgi:hypothetical protein